MNNPAATVNRRNSCTQSGSQHGEAATLDEKLDAFLKSYKLGHGHAGGAAANLDLHFDQQPSQQQQQLQAEVRPGQRCALLAGFLAVAAACAEIVPMPRMPCGCIALQLCPLTLLSELLVRKRLDAC